MSVLGQEIRAWPDLDSAVEHVAAVIGEHAAQADELARFPAEALAGMRATGLLGLVVPAAYHGRGGGLREVITVSERLARADLSAALIFAMHCQQAQALVEFAAGELREELLPRVGRGEVYLASVTTERGTGGHLFTSNAELGERDGMLCIERDAPVVTGVADADGFLITMRAPGASSPAQVSLVYADRAQVEVTVTGSWQPLGMRASHSVPVTISGTVRPYQVVGEHGGFRQIATEVFAPMAHLGWAACWLGAASGALARTVTLLRTPAGRSQFNLGSEILLTRLAGVRSRLDIVHAVLEHTLRVVTAGREGISSPPVQLLLNTLKVAAADECFAAVNELIELAGLRHGYMRGSALSLERVLRDLRSAALNYGNDRLRLASGSLTLLDPGVSLA